MTFLVDFLCHIRNFTSLHIKTSSLNVVLVNIKYQMFQSSIKTWLGYPKILFHFMFTGLSHLNMLLKLNGTFMLKGRCKLWWFTFVTKQCFFFPLVLFIQMLVVINISLDILIGTWIMKIIVCLFIDKKNHLSIIMDFWNKNKMDWSFDWNITKWKILYWFTFQICYWDSIYNVIQNDKFIWRIFFKKMLIV
jgi:hypothetical protein